MRSFFLFRLRCITLRCTGTEAYAIFKLRVHRRPVSYAVIWLRTKFLHSFLKVDTQSSAIVTDENLYPKRFLDPIKGCRHYKPKLSLANREEGLNLAGFRSKLDR
ncbi:MAG: hypothetical protein KME17_04435 [Cyanosarcina radialis HA8281-LM2]|nr:hypothetical protein [Cyanosarcina radialis HA8281-LM2]